MMYGIPQQHLSKAVVIMLGLFITHKLEGVGLFHEVEKVIVQWMP